MFVRISKEVLRLLIMFDLVQGQGTFQIVIGASISSR